MENTEPTNDEPFHAGELAVHDRLGIRHATVTHPPLFTVADSQGLRGQIAGGHTKNIVWTISAPVLACFHGRSRSTTRVFVHPDVD